MGALPILCVAWVLVGPPDIEPAVRIEDTYRFPCSTAKDNWLFAVAFCQMLERRIEAGYSEGGLIEEILVEARWYRDVADKLDDACRPEFPLEVRLRGLECVRRMIGREAYESGRWPVPVPLWRMPRIDP